MYEAGLLDTRFSESAVPQQLYVPEIARLGAANVNILQGNIETMKLPFEPGSFDYIILGDVLEHLKEPDKALLRLKIEELTYSSAAELSEEYQKVLESLLQLSAPPPKTNFLLTNIFSGQKKKVEKESVNQSAR